MYERGVDREAAAAGAPHRVWCRRRQAGTPRRAGTARHPGCRAPGRGGSSAAGRVPGGGWAAPGGQALSRGGAGGEGLASWRAGGGGLGAPRGRAGGWKPTGGRRGEGSTRADGHAARARRRGARDRAGREPGLGGGAGWPVGANWPVTAGLGTGCWPVWAPTGAYPDISIWPRPGCAGAQVGCYGWAGPHVTGSDDTAPPTDPWIYIYTYVYTHPHIRRHTSGHPYLYIYLSIRWVSHPPTHGWVGPPGVWRTGSRTRLRWGQAAGRRCRFASWRRR